MEYNDLALKFGRALDLNGNNSTGNANGQLGQVPWSLWNSAPHNFSYVPSGNLFPQQAHAVAVSPFARESQQPQPCSSSGQRRGPEMMSPMDLSSSAYKNLGQLRHGHNNYDRRKPKTPKRLKDEWSFRPSWGTEKNLNRRHSAGNITSNPPFETDPITLVRRQKQVDYGKNTVGYKNYTRNIPKTERKRFHPGTPDKTKKMSRRCWDGQIKTWRMLLHGYDDPDDKNNNVKQSVAQQTNTVNSNVDKPKEAMEICRNVLQ